MRIVSLLELTSAGQQIDGNNEGKQDVDGEIRQQVIHLHHWSFQQEEHKYR